MKILLIKDVPKIGQRGTVVDVKDGFGRNFLMRQGLGRIADKQAIAEAEARDAKIARTGAAKEAEQILYREKLEKTTLTYTKKANEKGHLFAALSLDELIETLHENGFPALTKKHITSEPLKVIGEHAVHVSIGGMDVAFHVIINPI
ncbi:MAG: 50S ribosomal protein L9 [Patescibacteria group bacterium]